MWRLRVSFVICAILNQRSHFAPDSGGRFAFRGSTRAEETLRSGRSPTDWNQLSYDGRALGIAQRAQGRRDLRQIRAGMVSLTFLN